MYISCMNNKFTLSSGSDNAVVCLQAPLYREAEGEQIAEYVINKLTVAFKLDLFGKTRGRNCFFFFLATA